MFSWWLGRGVEESQDEEGLEHEQPDTPAPVFAARALKSALFGAPPVDDDTLCEVEDEPVQYTREDTAQTYAGSISPSRPQGILLTPGTATFRRKTVSFDQEVKDKKEARNAGVKGQGLSRSPGQWHSDSASSDGKPVRKTSLTRQMERARERKTKMQEPDRSKDVLDVLGTTSCEVLGSKDVPDLHVKFGRETTGEMSKSNLLRQAITEDATLDLNQPHSQSGKFWKSEYEEYHTQAKLEMKKLLSYKQSAKSYAKLKDLQATTLADKLKEEQRNIVAMEDKIADLTARIATAPDGSEDESPMLVKELATQTALAIQYKRQVEAFKLSMEATDKEPSPVKSLAERSRSSRLDEILDGERTERRQAREQAKEVLRLEQKVQALQTSLASAEKQVNSWEAANKGLSQELQEANSKLQRQSEHTSTALRELQKNFEEAANNQCRDLESQIKHYRDETLELRKELDSLRKRSLESKTKEVEEARAMSLDERPSSGECHIPIPTQAIARPTKAAAKSNRSDTSNYSPVRPRSSHSALSEVVNSASADSVPPARSGPVHHTPASAPNRFSNQMLELDLDLLPPEKPSGTHAAPKKIQHASPRPSRFNFDITASPPKPVMVRNHPATTGQQAQLVGQRNGTDLGRQYVGSGTVSAALGSSRMGMDSLEGSSANGRVRKEVPPERAAAAKARLAEKERLRKMGGSGEGEKGEKNKENVRA